MKRTTQMLIGILFIGSQIPQTISSETLTIVNPSGNCREIEIDQTDRFFDVLNHIQCYMQEDGQWDQSDLIDNRISLNSATLNFDFSHSGIFVRSKSWRNYHDKVTEKERSDIGFILKTLAYDSHVEIKFAQSKLESAGDRIKPVHPFCFLIEVFGSDRLIAALQAIRQRTFFVWDGFIDGLAKSLEEEARADNLYQFTLDFANKVNLDPELITPSLKKKKWVEFVDILIDKIPRKKDANRYKKC